MHLPPCVRRASPLLLYVSPHLCCTIIQTQSCLRGKNCWICRDERSRGDAHREPKSLHFFFRYFTPSSRNVRERDKVRKERDSATRLSQKRCVRRRVCIKYRSEGWALAPHTLAFREGEKKGGDKIAQLKRSSLRDMLCTASSCVYASSYLSSVFCFFFFLFTLRCICDRLPSTYRKSLRTVLVTNAKEGSVPARQSHRISASRQLLLLLLLLLLHCCC